MSKLDERMASLETHVLYIKDRVDKLATKRELSLYKWMLGGCWLALLSIYGYLIGVK